MRLRLVGRSPSPNQIGCGLIRPFATLTATRNLDSKATGRVLASIPRMMYVGEGGPQQMLLLAHRNEPVDGSFDPRYLIYIEYAV
mgnify:CR=1 FL=1